MKKRITELFMLLAKDTRKQFNKATFEKENQLPSKEKII